MSYEPHDQVKPNYGDPQFQGQQPYYPPNQVPPGYPPAPYPPGDQGPVPPPVMQQPMAVPPMAQQPGVPPGLEYLTHLDQLLVKQKVEVLEAITGFETQNKYKVLNSMGQEVYKAKEDSNCCARQCCGPIRPFGMNVTDTVGNEVIHLERPLNCNSCCFPCCLQTIEVHSPPGTVIGRVDQKWTMCIPEFHVKDAQGTPILKIEGPFFTCSCFGSDVEFKVLAIGSDREVGMITKQWSGLLKEAFTDTDNFGVSFPKDLDVKAKATLLGAVFLIDFMFFEKSQNNENDGIGMA